MTQTEMFAKLCLAECCTGPNWVLAIQEFIDRRSPIFPGRPWLQLISHRQMRLQ